MTPALRVLLEGPADEAAIGRFLARNEFPIVDGRDVTFVYRGEADGVFLRCWIFGLDTAQPFERLAGTDLWATTIDLPKGSRVEYKFEVVRNGHGELILDPFNPIRAHDPFGANSVCQAEGYARPRWTFPDPGIRRGTLTELTVASTAFGEDRAVRIYLPSHFRRNRRYPLLVVHDGSDYVHFAALTTVLDNLIHAREIPQLIAVLTQSPDRLNEYAGDDRHAAFVADELPAAVGDAFPIQDDPALRGLMGASFGAVASLHAAWRYPQRFGRLLLQSGSFAFSDLGRHRRGPVFDPVVRFMNAFREAPGTPAEQIYMSCGIYESLIYENRSLVPRLQAANVDVKFDEVRDAHNWENWRDRLRSGLSWLFPGPLWMVYD